MVINLSETDLKKLQYLDRGGEASIYKYSEEYLLKIFHSSIDTSLKKKKIDILLNIELPDNVVKPLEAVYVNSKFAGYKMKYIANAVNLHNVQKPKFILKNKSDLKDLIQVLIEAGESIEKLHNLGFILGDIRGYNFLLKEKKVILY